jgi:hypothetical protein
MDKDETGSSSDEGVLHDAMALILLLAEVTVFFNASHSHLLMSFQ